MVQQHRHSYQRFFNTCSVSNTSAGYKNIQQTFFFSLQRTTERLQFLRQRDRQRTQQLSTLNLALQSRKQAE